MIDAICFLLFSHDIYCTNVFLAFVPQIDMFFEFSDRLESIMAKAYIWRYSHQTVTSKITGTLNKEYSIKYFMNILRYIVCKKREIYILF